MLKIALINGFDLIYQPALETRLATFVIDNGLHQFMLESTRGTNTLDLLIINDPIAVSYVFVTCPFSISDHRCVKWRVWLPNHYVQQLERATRQRFDFQSVDCIGIYSFLNNINWAELFKIVAPSDVNGLWAFLSNIFVML